MLAGKLKEFLTQKKYDVKTSTDFGIPSFGLRISEGNHYLATLWLEHEFFHIGPYEFVLESREKSSIIELVSVVNQIKRDFYQYGLRDVRFMSGRNRIEIEELV